MARRSYDRGHDPVGSARQLGAIVASGDRTAQVRTITAPTVVIHGTRDPLVRPLRAVAPPRRAIPGARLVMVEGMGHDLPRGAWPQIIDAIIENARQRRPAPGQGARARAA